MKLAARQRLRGAACPAFPCDFASCRSGPCDWTGYVQSAGRVGAGRQRRREPETPTRPAAASADQIQGVPRRAADDRRWRLQQQRVLAPDRLAHQSRQCGRDFGEARTRQRLPRRARRRCRPYTGGTATKKAGPPTTSTTSSCLHHGSAGCASLPSAPSVEIEEVIVRYAGAARPAHLKGMFIKSQTETAPMPLEESTQPVSQVVVAYSTVASYPPGNPSLCVEGLN